MCARTSRDRPRLVGSDAELGAEVLVAALMAQWQRRDPLMRGMSFACIMGVTSILIHSWVDFNLQIPANAAYFMVLLALGWIANFVFDPRRRPQNIARSLEASRRMLPSDWSVGSSVQGGSTVAIHARSTTVNRSVPGPPRATSEESSVV